MQITPENVRALAKAKSDENWRFRSFLKASPMSEKAMDALVAGTADRIWAKVDCTQCANCCKEIALTLNAQDIARIAEHLGKTPRALIKEYFVPDVETVSDGEEGPYWRMKELTCAFLKDNRCSIYEHRPATCRKYPYLNEPGFVWRTMTMLEQVETCPIVYQVLEELKQELEFNSGQRDACGIVNARRSVGRRTNNGQTKARRKMGFGAE